MELRLQQKGDFYEKPHFTMENFKFWGPVKWGLKIFAPNYQKAHFYAKIWSNKSFGVCGSDVVLTLESDEKKKYARIAIGNSMSSITQRPLPCRRDESNLRHGKTIYGDKAKL